MKRDTRGVGEHRQHNGDPEVYHRHVKLVRSLRSIAEREHEAGEEGGEVEPFEDDAENLASLAEEIGGAKGSGEDTEDEEEITLQELVRREQAGGCREMAVELVEARCRLTIANHAKSILIL